MTDLMPDLMPAGIPPELARTATDARRDREAAEYFAQMVGHLGRALTALEGNRWDSARDHLYSVRELSAITDASLNSGQPDPKDFLAQVRALVPKEWADAIRSALTAPAPAASSAAALRKIANEGDPR